MTETGYCVIKLFGNIPKRILKKGKLLRGMLELVYTYLSNLWLQLKTCKKMQLIHTVLHTVKTSQADFHTVKLANKN
jgi:hypothetical protein